jgi:hypothetical protein
MEMSGQPHGPAAPLPVPIGWEARCPPHLSRRGGEEKKNSCPYRKSNPGRSVSSLVTILIQRCRLPRGLYDHKLVRYNTKKKCVQISIHNAGQTFCRFSHSFRTKAVIRIWKLAEVKELVQLYLHSPNTPPWHGAQLKHRDNFTLPLPLLRFILYSVCFMALDAKLPPTLIQRHITYKHITWTGFEPDSMHPTLHRVP